MSKKEYIYIYIHIYSRRHELIKPSTLKEGENFNVENLTTSNKMMPSPHAVGAEEGTLTLHK